MRWTPGKMSRNVEDRRGQRMGGGAKMGIGGTIILAILSLVFGQDLVSGSGGALPEGLAHEVMPVGHRPRHGDEQPARLHLSAVEGDAADLERRGGGTASRRLNLG